MTDDDDDTYANRSRCPECDAMVIEGSAHGCPGGRNREVFINPWEENMKKLSVKQKRQDDKK